MRKGQQKLINMLKKANVSEENIQEFARSTEPLPTLKACAYQLMSGTDVTMEDAKRYIDDGITFDLNDKITISLTRNGCVHIPVVRKYRERLQYAESLPSGPEHFPREGLVELYSIGLSETDIDRLIGAYRDCESGSYIISQDIKAEKEYLRYARATYGRKDTWYIDHSMAWKESYLILNAVEYLYNAGYDIDRLTAIIPQLADYERELIPIHTMRNNGRRRLVQQCSLDKNHPGLISAINNDTEDKAPELVTRNMPEVHPAIHRTLPELGNVLYSCSNRINELQNILIRMVAGTHKFPDLSGAFEDPVNKEDPEEFARDIMERTKENGAVKAEVFPTPHGAAVITDHGFDVRLLDGKWKDYMDKGDITLKRDDLLCIAWQTNDIDKKGNNIAVKLRQMEDMYLRMASLAQSGIAHSRPETAKKLAAMYQGTNRMFSDAFTGLCKDFIAWNDL